MTLIIVFAIIVGLLRIAIVAAILIRNYSFFESVVVCLLLFIFSSMAIAEGEAAEKLRSGLSDEDELKSLIAAGARSIAYGIIFLMALVKLVIALLQ